mgnify:CR=1 FL=1
MPQRHRQPRASGADGAAVKESPPGHTGATRLVAHAKAGANGRGNEEGAAALLRAAQADGRRKAGDPAFMANVLQGQLKTFAFWPQVAMGQPGLDETQEAAVVETAVDMFLCYWGVAMPVDQA